MVVAEGEMDSETGAFVVECLGHPPPETREVALRAIGGAHLDVFRADARRVKLATDDAQASPWLAQRPRPLVQSITLYVSPKRQSSPNMCEGSFPIYIYLWSHCVFDRSSPTCTSTCPRRCRDCLRPNGGRTFRLECGHSVVSRRGVSRHHGVFETLWTIFED